MLLPLGVEFVFLPEPVDIGFIGSGSAVGAVVIGVVSWARYRPVPMIAQDAAFGAIGFGIVALIVWIFGLAGVPFG
jgi:hypothetical protein